MLDTDILAIHKIFRHIYPDFTLNHITVYRSLWQIAPLSGEQVIKETKLSRFTVYKILAELVATGLVKKTNFKPIGYYAENPVKAYHFCAQKVTSKLKRRRGQLKKLIDNASGLSNEEYLLKLDGGQTKLIHMQTHERITDEETLRQYKVGLDNNLKELERKKLKAWQLVGKVN